jgi:large subunit ribosomal protein L6
MSRIGRRAISIPSGVSVEAQGATVKVKGPKGSLSGELPRGITIAIDKGTVTFARPDDSVKTRALHGLARALVANMVTGVVEPFVKELEIQGVGYRADVSGKNLNLLLGFSHPVAVPIPDGLKVSVDRNVVIKIEGIDRRQVGQFAANIRELRPPEPYKGKGIRYLGEHVRRKVGKAAAGSSAG